MGDLPIENCADTLKAEHQIAVAKIAMDQAGRHDRRLMTVEPAERKIEHRSMLPRRGVERAEVCDLPRRGRGPQADPTAVDRVDLRKDFSRLGRKPGAGRGKGGIAQHPPRQGLPLDAIHDEAATQVIVRAQIMPDHGCRHACGDGGLDHPRLQLRPDDAITEAIARRHPPQDQGSTATIGTDQIEGPCLLAGATGQALQSYDLDRRRFDTRRKGAQRRGKCGQCAIAHALSAPAIPTRRQDIQTLPSLPRLSGGFTGSEFPGQPGNRQPDGWHALAIP